MQSPQKQPAERIAAKHRVWWFGLFLIAATFLAYGPALRGGFVWDDDNWTTNLSKLFQYEHGLRVIWFQPTVLQQYYPLTGTSFWLDYQLWGFWTTPYHIENVALHLLSVFLFWRLLLRLKIPGAWLAAGLFALHPVMVESVAWITERKNVLSLALYLGALLANLRGAEESKVQSPRSKVQRLKFKVFYWLALMLFAGAMLAKTTAYSLPAVILLLAWWQRGRIRWRTDVMPTLPFFGLALGLCALTFWLEKHHVGAQGSDFDLTFGQRNLVAGRAFWFYLGKLFWPVNLCFVYPRWQPDTGAWWQWLYPATAAGGMLGLWLARKRLGCGPTTALLFYVGTLFPLLGFLNAYGMRYSFVWDHWVYLSSLGIFALAATGVARLGERLRTPGLACGFAVIALPVLGVLTWREAGAYRDMDTRWRTTLARNPDCWMAHSDLASSLLAQGRLEEAIQHFERAVELQPDHAEAYYNLGNALARQKKWVEAVRQFEQALALKPDYAEVHGNLGAALAAEGKLTDAIQHDERALELKPDDVNARCNLGLALATEGKMDAAIQQFGLALQLKPDDTRVRCNLGNALAAEGRMDEAIQQFELAVQLKPDDAEARGNLGAALTRQGNLTEAISQLERAVQLKPDFIEAHYNLGVALAAQGKPAEAVLHFQQALALATAQGNAALAASIRARLQALTVAPHP